MHVKVEKKRKTTRATLGVKKEIIAEHVNGVRVSYLASKHSMPKCHLLLDNAPTHPTVLEQGLVIEFYFAKLRFLPPNTNPILQPIDQRVISNVKKLST